MRRRPSRGRAWREIDARRRWRSRAHRWRNTDSSASCRNGGTRIPAGPVQRCRRHLRAACQPVSRAARDLLHCERWTPFPISCSFDCPVSTMSKAVEQWPCHARAPLQRGAGEQLQPTLGRGIMQFDATRSGAQANRAQRRAAAGSSGSYGNDGIVEQVYLARKVYFVRTDRRAIHPRDRRSRNGEEGCS